MCGAISTNDSWQKDHDIRRLFAVQGACLMKSAKLYTFLNVKVNKKKYGILINFMLYYACKPRLGNSLGFMCKVINRFFTF
jgi:hypothetical protein